MKKNNPALIRDLERFILELKSMKRENGFEVACGECHVTKDLFQNMFKNIDLLD